MYHGITIHSGGSKDDIFAKLITVSARGGEAVAVGQLDKASVPHVHFIGIGGAGMSAIASILLERGYRVSGSDVALHDYTRRLIELGATVYEGHDAAHVAGADAVVYTTAVSADNVELLAAHDLKIPVLHRSEMLAQLMQAGVGIAIAGAHGKTTTTSMVAWILERAGLDPTFLVGGVVANLDTGAKAGAGQYVIAEADESDGSFLNYEPAIAVITNIEADHLEHYGGEFDQLKKAYQQFADRIPEEGLLISCADEVEAQSILAGASCHRKTYSVRGYEANLIANNVHFDGRGSRSDIYLDGEYLGVIELQVPGYHNISNALGAMLVALEVGVPFPVIRDAMKLFRGALRRFQVHYDHGGIMVVDDYAHHPTEIKAIITAAKATGKRIIAVFQPQRYTRTYHLFDDFTHAFSEAQEVVIATIYSPAGEQPIAGVNSSRLAEMVRVNSNSTATFIPNNAEILMYLQEIVQPGDLVLTMGAGDIWKVAKEFSVWLESKMSLANQI